MEDHVFLTSNGVFGQLVLLILGFQPLLLFVHMSSLSHMELSE
ncbi:hypothetical protein SAMD00020551_1640 [Mesobacillus selenatarsenatis SF-1]|uniref:Uncharacterized protein n=1 Tax=Mesobacillus selenatarsenatis (strain DSM 18680 / JCM 14380 / FERM P-15431 / SF-1) TaxID=1321606 RepID=A0A0A8X0I8_MESS1|nr:hypothetical protein SAMD00020551_1640 [Mesobacillus selenatarsenatis SF-1]